MVPTPFIFSTSPPALAGAAKAVHSWDQGELGEARTFQFSESAELDLPKLDRVLNQYEKPVVWVLLLATGNSSPLWFHPEHSPRNVELCNHLLDNRHLEVTFVVCPTSQEARHRWGPQGPLQSSGFAQECFKEFWPTLRDGVNGVRVWQGFSKDEPQVAQCESLICQIRDETSKTSPPGLEGWAFKACVGFACLVVVLLTMNWGSWQGSRDLDPQLLQTHKPFIHPQFEERFEKLQQIQDALGDKLLGLTAPQEAIDDKVAKLTQLQTAVDKEKSSRDALDSRLAQLEANQQVMDAASQESAAKLTQLQTAVDEEKSSRDALDSRLAQLEASQQVMDAASQQSAAKLTQLQTAVDQEKSSRDALDSRLAQLEANQQVMDAASQESAAKLTQLQTAVDEEKSSRDALDSRLAQLEASQQVMDAASQESAAKLTQLQTAVDEEKSVRDALDSRLARLEASQQVMDAASQQSAAKLTQLQTAVDEEKSSRDALDSRLARLEASQQVMDTASQQCAAKLTELQTSVGEFDDSIHRFQIALRQELHGSFFDLRIALRQELHGSFFDLRIALRRELLQSLHRQVSALRRNVTHLENTLNWHNNERESDRKGHAFNRGLQQAKCEAQMNVLNVSVHNLKSIDDLDRKVQERASTTSDTSLQDWVWSLLGFERKQTPQMG
ncbi:CD209 [Symbiodinium sp. CCMP2592]|nr:CD209 [Symbiodinium sp. CCMP2592]